ncbi:LysR family transcriptional regulator [Pseudomaricurvus alkylphenolicus]|uniref:LysR family transcriptional regulator n=1 Tax=Pseudomaricurvus alkylphenolicus TaxID=1306991 RepID=UPI00141EDC6F|nr:LysR family transcriptional regulator [Pseudomaricurvus alkylphenolicus]NIB38406.1 LysR family transcriptional regulator [Pseudomaricurvus alkylphenolicus]
MQDAFHNIDIKLLRIFRTVAKRQSFSLAADELNTSPSNISMNMAQLESRLQMRLCERGVKGFRLTKQGQQVLDASDEFYGAMRKFQDQLQLVAEGEHEVVRIGVLSETIVDVNMRISDILRDLETLFPGICFHLEFEPAVRLKDRVAEGDLHCAFGYFENLSSSFRSRYLYSERHLCYCSREHELFQKPDSEISSLTLKSYRVAGYDDLGEEEVREMMPVLGKLDSYSRTSEGVLALILTGNYIGLLPEGFAQYWCERDMIRVIDRQEVELSVDIEVIYKSSRSKESMIQALLESINRFYPVSRKNSNEDGA